MIFQEWSFCVDLNSTFGGVLYQHKTSSSEPEAPRLGLARVLQTPTSRPALSTKRLSSCLHRLNSPSCNFWTKSDTNFFKLVVTVDFMDLFTVYDAYNLANLLVESNPYVAVDVYSRFPLKTVNEQIFTGDCSHPHETRAVWASTAGS